VAYSAPLVDCNVHAQVLGETAGKAEGLARYRTPLSLEQAQGDQAMIGDVGVAVLVRLPNERLMIIVDDDHDVAVFADERSALSYMKSSILKDCEYQLVDVEI
jgi:hypothetical protein